ncbi:30S ribosomal protein S9 [Candidatus Falkowbacteria bacterium RIFOXYD2_FULL_35_9]|uniref:Small ribosomal subunit protein uS9 n=1 Tax=Candidatus Falkowbacteria bacterium RIFOXYC2_FULL_36_12 TaxID=1798002 RepID=A0A1F5T0C9_9BACT|nr:MAG: 30S ribosomal protein S9 [Candidatus Falkowbacteria bacterium RIFOXYB2_FULL_35_7]OGF31921.1 MAG: 30S ribosomal protein S9 [Candidatus Falkowbacteria bacterium RIFOXYC2_FULL_36_12]OGF33191.1 MAG: 30S ribosomal protein S9 [Candidatus Falkowbacteria bacterium RIFOXYA2_FULL_35_8]OGF46197.1 MAG: 30S ribosomal protein S9 [Candidatus Falkowbacteria bacterium RIFOXYD2_FULL_35_9]
MVEEVVVEEDKKRGEYLYSVGKRKTSVAQVRVYKKGEGKFTVNEKAFEVYFPTFELQEIVRSPQKLIGQGDKLNVTVKVSGGGISSQAEAIRNGIAKALIQLNPNFRKPLKKAGYITRDARKKERKKPGLKRARRAPQWRKR